MMLLASAPAPLTPMPASIPKPAATEAANVVAWMVAFSVALIVMPPAAVAVTP
jgi:hypothetical protein